MACDQNALAAVDGFLRDTFRVEGNLRQKMIKVRTTSPPTTPSVQHKDLRIASYSRGDFLSLETFCEFATCAARCYGSGFRSKILADP